MLEAKKSTCASREARPAGGERDSCNSQELSSTILRTTRRPPPFRAQAAAAEHGIWGRLEARTPEGRSTGRWGLQLPKGSLLPNHEVGPLQRDVALRFQFEGGLDRGRRAGRHASGTAH